MVRLITCEWFLTATHDFYVSDNSETETVSTPIIIMHNNVFLILTIVSRLAIYHEELILSHIAIICYSQKVQHHCGSWAIDIVRPSHF